MSAGRIPTTANSPLTAKGDLFGYSTQPARLAVGSDGDTIVADASTATGLRWQGSYPAGKNLLINGLLDIWQRSTSVTGTLDGYRTVDRWYLISSASCTFAQETSVVPLGCRYSQKVTVGASASSTQAYQAVETSNAVAYAGQNLTFSGRFQSSATPTVNLVVEWSTDVDKALASGGWTSITASSGGSGTAGSSSFTTISGVYAIPSTAKSLRISFNTTSMASGAILYYGGFQAELGVVVTSLVRNGATIQGETSACMRYYYRAITASAYTAFGIGQPYATTAAQVVINHPVAMRIPPASVDFSTLALTNAGGGVLTFSSLTLSNAGNLTSMLNITGAVGLVGGDSTLLIANNSTSAFLGFSAEL